MITTPPTSASTPSGSPSVRPRTPVDGSVPQQAVADMPADSVTFTAVPAQTPPSVQGEVAPNISQGLDLSKIKKIPIVMYFPLTDRFSDGDPSNNQGVDRNNPTAFHGGDLRGLINKLDYIKELGCNALWLAPIQHNTFEAQWGDYHGMGYHGYWINDNEKIDPHEGDLAIAKELVKKAHEKGIAVVLDTVLNQVGYDHPFAKDPNKKDWFHHNGPVKDWDNQWQAENCDLAGLPDWNQQNPEAFEYLLNNTAHWVKELGADGVRLDAVKHVSKDFWAKFVPALKERVENPDLFVVGEVLNGDPNYLSAYQKAGVDHLFDMPMYFTIKDVFGNGGSCRLLGQRLAEDSKYPDASKMVTLLDNHDFPRFMNTAQGSMEERVERLKLATAFLMATRGTPSIYYGDETALEGGPDPDNRRDMDFDRRPDVRQAFTQLIDIRNSQEVLRDGKQLEMWQDDQVYAFARRNDKQEVVAVFNNSGGGSTRDIPLREGSHLHNGQELVDQISGQSFKVENGKIHLDMPGRTAFILAAKN